MIAPELIEAMAKAGITADQIAATVKHYAALTAESRAEKREQNRIRQQNHRDRNAPSRVTERDTPALDKEKSPTPPKEIKPSPLPPSGARASGFADFWALFPNKVGKRDAEHAFAKALQRADLTAILAGARRYSAKTDDRPWCNPATFLNQDRWADQPAGIVPQQRAQPPPAKRTINDALDDIINGKKPHEPTSTTIDASFERTDRGSVQSVVQFDAFSARNRS